MDFATLIIAMSIPSAITGFCFWLIERRIKAMDDEEKAERERKRKAQEAKDERRRKYELCQLNLTAACVALAEANARALKTIPDAHCNGDMSRALEYVEEVKREQRDFLKEQAVNSMDF